MMRQHGAGGNSGLTRPLYPHAGGGMQVVACEVKPKDVQYKACQHPGQNVMYRRKKSAPRTQTRWGCAPEAKRETRRSGRTSRVAARGPARGDLPGGGCTWGGVRVAATAQWPPAPAESRERARRALMLPGRDGSRQEEKDGGASGVAPVGVGLLDVA
eukprot:scaffold4312_cov101-Isochrysis_galbana.AAC.2